MADVREDHNIMTAAGGPGDLAAEVFDKNLCAVCGACVGRCPYLLHQKGRVMYRDTCTLTTGPCYRFCPMAEARGDFKDELGAYKKILIAQGTIPDITKKAQAGGVVSTLVSLALTRGVVKEAVLTSGHPEEPPRGIRVRSRREVLAASASRYAASGVVAALNQALLEPGTHPLAMVGTPCQIKAAAAMRTARDEDLSFNPKRIKLLIGLFCTWALDYRRLDSYLRYMLFGERASGYDIPPPPANVFKVYTGDGIKAFPLEEVRTMSLNACSACDDMTSVKADISVGTVEGVEDWNTVIVRTTAGQRLLDMALDNKLLRVDELPASDLEHLREAAAIKKERGRTVWNNTRADKG